MDCEQHHKATDVLPTSGMFTTKQASAWLKISESTLEKFRLYGGGPRYIKAGRGSQSRVVYDPADLRDWVEEHKRASTSTGGKGA